MKTVSLVKTGDGVRAALTRSLGLLGGPGRFIAPGDRVMIKPNLNDAESFTSAELVEALVHLLRGAGAGDIVIAESTFGDAAMTDALFRKTGFTDLAARIGVPLVNLNRSEAVELAVPRPVSVEMVRVAREALDGVRIVNIPVMKVHYATGLSLCLKNLKGLLVGPEKKRFHDMGLEGAIADLCSVVRPALNLVDGSSCMEGMGPKGGDVFATDLLFAGDDMGAVDCVAAEVMGFSPEEVRHLAHYLAAEGVRPEDIRVEGEAVCDCIRPFRRAAINGLVPPCVRIHEAGACSACMNALLLSFRLMEKEVEEYTDIFVGEGPHSGGIRGVAFGKCAAADPRFVRSVRGCPPYPFELGKIVR